MTKEQYDEFANTLTLEYSIGDMFEILAYDQGDEKWEHGYLTITEIHTAAEYKNHWCYSCECSGGLRWTAVGIAAFQDRGERAKFLHKKYIGNINKDPALRVLYGPKV